MRRREKKSPSDIMTPDSSRLGRLWSRWPTGIFSFSHGGTWRDGWQPSGGAGFSHCGGESRFGFTDRGGWLTLFVFFSKYNQMCGSCWGQRSRVPFGKMQNNKTSKDFFFLLPLLLLFLLPLLQCPAACTCVIVKTFSRSQFPPA